MLAGCASQTAWDPARFPASYFDSRERFRNGAQEAGLRLQSYPIRAVGPGGEELTIDVAIRRVASPRVVLISSALHGVEGYLGAAIQLALLDGRKLPESAGLVLVHALNPWGYAHGRRWNEYNIDLNRNFLLEGERYQTPNSEAAALFAELNEFLNPTTPGGGLLEFELKAAGLLMSHGSERLKLIATGQYEYPQGLFYGGSEPAQLQEILRMNILDWIGDAEEVLHLDVHTGLGKRGLHKLLNNGSARERLAELEVRFAPSEIEFPKEGGGTAYAAHGAIGAWLATLLPGARYVGFTAEFGTYSNTHVLRALRAENRAFHWSAGDSALREKARADLIEAFAPADPAWRAKTLTDGLCLVDQAFA